MSIDNRHTITHVLCKHSFPYNNSLKTIIFGGSPIHLKYFNSADFYNRDNKKCLVLNHGQKGFCKILKKLDLFTNLPYFLISL